MDKKSKLARQLYPSLPNWEIALLSGTWAFSIAYALSRVLLLSRKHYAYFAEYELVPDWLGNGVWRRDTSDHEWEGFSSHLFVALPWMVLQLVGTQILKKYNHQLLPAFNCTLSIIYFAKNFGSKMMFSMVVQPVLYFVAYLTKRKSAVWAVSLATLLSLTANTGPFYRLMRGLIEGDEYSAELYLAHVTWAWINARALSYCMDKLDGVTQSHCQQDRSIVDELVDMIGYVLYVPTAISGPIVVYRKYHKGMSAPYKPWTKPRVKNVCFQVLRYSAWYTVAQIALHFSYHAALRYTFKFVVQLDDMWSVAGVALANAEFFHLKYVLFYGIPRVFAVEDGIEDFPQHPASPFRIHLYRDMWRLFDVGLYEFIVLYIYIPFMKICSEKNSALMKFASSMVAFAYIYVWHGIQPVIMMWSTFNFVSVSLETLGETIGNTATYRNFENSYLSKGNVRRIRALFITPLFIFSMCGNFYFLVGRKIAERCMEMAVRSWPLGTPILFVIVYCGTHFGIEMKNWDIKRKLDEIKMQ